jgi:hypothetical protein
MTMSRSTINFILDLVSLINLLGLMITGIIMRYVLPPGTGGLGRIAHGGGRGQHIKQLWSMTRHQWGDVHFWLSAVFVVLMLAHIVLHWNWIKIKMKSMWLKKNDSESERI